MVEGAVVVLRSIKLVLCYEPVRVRGAILLIRPGRTVLIGTVLFRTVLLLSESLLSWTVSGSSFRGVRRTDRLNKAGGSGAHFTRQQHDVGRVRGGVGGKSAFWCDADATCVGDHFGVSRWLDVRVCAHLTT